MLEHFEDVLNYLLWGSRVHQLINVVQSQIDVEKGGLILGGTHFFDFTGGVVLVFDSEGIDDLRAVGNEPNDRVNEPLDRVLSHKE